MNFRNLHACVILQPLQGPVGLAYALAGQMGISPTKAAHYIRPVHVGKLNI
jgi:hypothetical protein